MKNRIELAQYFGTLGYTKGAEIGVYKGQYSEILCKSIPNLRLICIDNWEAHRRREVMEEMKARLAPYKTIIVWNNSMEVIPAMLDESFDFVFIDAAHDYEHVKEDITEWGKKVKKGGIVSGHDYYDFPSGKGGVIEAVDEYVKEHSYKLNIIPWDKENPDRDNRQPCWWFQK